MKTFKILAALSVTSCLFLNISAANAFECPNPNQIDSKTPFAPPSYIWFAPRMPSSTNVGFGVGKYIVGSFIKSQPATVDNKPGWVCLYKTTDRASTADIDKIKNQLPKEVMGMVGQLATYGEGIGTVFYKIKS